MANIKKVDYYCSPYIKIKRILTDCLMIVILNQIYIFTRKNMIFLRCVGIENTFFLLSLKKRSTIEFYLVFQIASLIFKREYKTWIYSIILAERYQNLPDFFSHLNIIITSTFYMCQNSFTKINNMTHKAWLCICNTFM